MMSNENKENLCNKYKKTLELIGVVNKGFILQKQLINLMLLLEIVENSYQARKSIEELEDGQIIKKINFMDTKNKIIILRKFGIRFLEGKKGSGSVGAIRTCTTNQRYFRSILFNHNILKILQDKTCLEFAKEHSLYKLLNGIHSNLSLDNLTLYKNYISKLGVNKSALQAHISLLEAHNKQKEQAFIKSAQRRVGVNTEPSKPNKKKSAKEQRQDLMLNSTLETLKRKDCYLTSHNQKNNTWNFLILDTLNNQNTKKIIENIATIYYVSNDLNQIEFKVNITISVWDYKAKEKIINDLNKDMYRALRDTYRITNQDWLKSVNIVDVEMNKNYLGNIIKFQY